MSTWDLLWFAFTATSLTGFIVLEIVGRRGNTYSEHIRRWLGINPPHPRRRWAVRAFVVSIVVFNVWFIPHIVLSW